MIYLQSTLPPDEVWASLPAAFRRTIRERKLRLFTLDAAKIARESTTLKQMQTRMQGIALLGAFLRLTSFREEAELTDDELFHLLDRALGKYFGKGGQKLVAANLVVARRGYREVAEIEPGDAGPAGSAEPGWHWESPASPAEGSLIPEDFCGRILGDYAHGRESDLEADEFAARSLIPASTARERSFRHLAPDIPVFITGACVGCMECVNECPDTAILARVVEEPQLEASLRAIEPARRDELRRQFAVTSKYHHLFVKRGEAGGLFGLFIDPDKCKGCGECVTVCGSHGALEMVPKSELDLPQYDAGMALLRHAAGHPPRASSRRSRSAT